MANYNGIEFNNVKQHGNFVPVPQDLQPFGLEYKDL